MVIVDDERVAAADAVHVLKNVTPHLGQSPCLGQHWRCRPRRGGHQSASNARLSGRSIPLRHLALRSCRNKLVIPVFPLHVSRNVICACKPVANTCQSNSVGVGKKPHSPTKHPASDSHLLPQMLQRKGRSCRRSCTLSSDFRKNVCGKEGSQRGVRRGAKPCRQRSPGDCVDNRWGEDVKRAIPFHNLDYCRQKAVLRCGEEYGPAGLPCAQNWPRTCCSRHQCIRSLAQGQAVAREARHDHVPFHLADKLFLSIVELHVPREVSLLRCRRWP